MHGATSRHRGLDDSFVGFWQLPGVADAFDWLWVRLVELGLDLDGKLSGAVDGLD